MMAISFQTCLHAQVGFSISSQPVMSNGHLSIEGLVLQLKNYSKFNGECEVRIFSDRFMKTRIASSKIVLIQNDIHSFDLSEIFSSANFPWSDVSVKTVCFQLYATKKNIPLGITCFDVVPVLSIDKKEHENKNLEKIKKHVSANLSYQYESWPFEESIVDRHLLNYSGELRVEEIPFKFQGYVQSTKDSYFDYGFANGKLFLDVDQWKEILTQKLKPKFDEKLDSLLSQYPEYEYYKSRDEYIDKITSAPSYLKDLSETDSVFHYAEQLSLPIENDIEKLKQKVGDSLNRAASRMNEIFYDSTGMLSDSLRAIKLELEDKVSAYKNLELLLSKKEAFDNLNQVQREAKKYLANADGIVDEYDAQIKTVLGDPSKLNKLLKKEGIGSSLSSLVNYLSKLDIGNINPSYSELVLQNNFMQGVELGLDLNQIGLSAFYGKSNSRNTVSVKDSSFTAQQLFGFNLTSDFQKKSRHEIFFIGNLPNQGEYILERETILGYNNKYDLGETQELTLSLALSSPFDFDGRNSREFGSNGAALLAYDLSSKNSIFDFSTKIEFYGSEYQDIDNPFLINNSIEVFNNITINILNDFTLGVNSIVQKNGVYNDAIEEPRQIFSNGISLSFNHVKLPSFSYTYNRLENDFGEIDSKGDFHVLNISKVFQLGTIDVQSFANFNYVSNQSSLDSLNTSLNNFLLSTEINWSDKVRTTLAYNFQNSNTLLEDEKNESFVVKIPLQFSKLNVSPGLQYINRNNKKEFGFSLESLVNIWDDLNISLGANSHSFYSFLGVDETIKTLYTPEVKLRLNYRF